MNSGIDVPIHVLVAFQNINRKGNVVQSKDFFYRHHVFSAQCNIGTESFFQIGMKGDYGNQKSCHVYGELVSGFDIYPKK